MLMPLFNDHAGIHQWNIMVKELVPWVKVGGLR